jgi:hypothetical protein
MALREFTDSHGRAWRVWDVSPESLHPTTRGEDFMQGYLEGWLAFESMDGEAKCRLTPIPRDWESAADEDLEQLLHLAEPVRGERTSGPQARIEAAAVTAAAPAAGPARPGSRSFRFPNGRHWAVAEWTVAGRRGQAEQRVLRFSAGSRSLDLERYPRDWVTFSDAHLAALLAEGFPRDPHRPNPTTHRRRATDGEEAADR